MVQRKRRCIGVYGTKTRALQRKISYEAFGLTFKDALVYRYLGDKNNTANQNINNIGNAIFMEVPDRAYDTNTVPMPVAIERMASKKTDYSRFGLIDPIANETTLRVHIDDFEDLGRDLIVSDVLEFPFYKNNAGENTFWEVTDTDIDPNEEFYATIFIQPLGESRQTNDIPIDSGVDGILDGVGDEREVVQSEDVPSEDEVFEGTPPEEEVDYRDKDQASFLDDPSQTF
jgi:hypothetical protein